jgi:hypothetical protein
VDKGPELKEANQIHCLQKVCEYDYGLLNFATTLERSLQHLGKVM